VSDTFIPPVRESDDPEYAANLRRATLASTAGSALEYYDFALFGLASALIFSKLFFGNLDPATALIASFATFGVGFVARPLGGLFFGTYGDKLGRKWVLVATILLMGGSSTLVGALPTYETIGVWAPILPVFLRLCQGFVRRQCDAWLAVRSAARAFRSPDRYLGVAIAREFSAVIAGGLAGVLGAILIKEFNGSWLPLAIYTFVLAFITVVSTFLTPETKGRDLTRINDAIDDVHQHIPVTQ
jgi:MFS transporter, MHS family, metabolite:H+ symporter